MYAYRVGLTGVELLRTGELETNVSMLAEIYGFDGVPELVAAKRSGQEHARIDPAIIEQHESMLDRLHEHLLAAELGSLLPPAPTNVDELNDWLIDRRLDAVR